MARRRLRDMDIGYNLGVYASFVKRYKALFVLAIIVITAVEGLRVIDRFLFKVIVDKGTSIENGKLIIENFASVLVLIAVVFLGALFLRVIGTWMKIHLVNILEARMVFDLKRRFFNHLVHLSHNFHTTHKTGSLISRLVRGGSAIERMTDVVVFNIAPLILQFIAVTASLIYFDWVPAIIVVLTMVAFIGYSVIMQRVQHKHNIFANKMEDKEKAYVSDAFTNIDSIKYFGKENMVKSRFKRLGKTTKDSFFRLWGYFRWMDAVQSLILGLGTFFIVYFPLVKLLDGEMTLGTVVFIYTIYGNIIPPMYGFVHGIRGMYRAMADFQDLFQYGKITNEIKDKENAKQLHIKQGEVEFKNVSFKYHKQYVLKNFDLHIKKDEKVAFVGHSGSGKSTIVRLLYRLYDLEEGAIKIDGNNIKEVKQESLRSELSIVPQECILFDDTIYNNILFSNPKASKKDVWKAIRFAQLDKMIKVLPNKEKTIVGERGVKLSGGEKQRVSIARALLANKQILVLDEATSALDSQTEHDIQRDLERLMKGRTSIMIAHRLSTIMNADKIVVIANGKIVQLGTHKQLIRKEGQYKKLWNLQKGGYIK